MKKIIYTLLAILVLTALLSACGSQAGTPTAVVSNLLPDLIIAEGHLKPNQALYLSFMAGGQVEELLVESGDSVKAGQVLARLGDRQPAQAALAAAEASLVSAQQNLDILTRNASLAQSHAQLALAKAQKIYEDAKTTRLNLRTGTNLLDAAEYAEAQYNIAVNRENDLQEAYDDLDNLAENDTNRAQAFSALYNARENTKAKLRLWNWYKGQASSNDVAIADGDVALAEAQVEDAQRTFDRLQNGPDPEKLALAQAALNMAQAQVEAAWLGLDNYDLKAPFDGIVQEVNVKVNQMVSTSTWVVALADTSQWYVDTSDLSELDVVDLSLGQAATLVADSLPGVTMSGVIESISGAPIIQGGDVQYVVHILLNDPDPRLRWGMTIEVTFLITK